MGHYISNVRDVEFNLFEALSIDKALAVSYTHLTLPTILRV